MHPYWNLDIFLKNVIIFQNSQNNITISEIADLQAHNASHHIVSFGGTDLFVIGLKFFIMYFFQSLFETAL